MPFSRDILVKTLTKLPYAVSVADMQQEDQPLIYVNDAFLELTGYDRDECLGHNCRFLQDANKNDPAKEKIKDAIDNEETISINIRNQRKSGESFLNHIELFPVYDDQDDLSVYCAFQKEVPEPHAPTALYSDLEEPHKISAQLKDALNSLKTCMSSLQALIHSMNKNYDNAVQVALMAEVIQQSRKVDKVIDHVYAQIDYEDSD